MGTGGRPRVNDALVEGLNHHERLARVDGTLYGDRYHSGLLQRVEELESAQRRRAMPWFIRWLITLRLKRNDARRN